MPDVKLIEIESGRVHLVEIARGLPGLPGTGGGGQASYTGSALANLSALRVVRVGSGGQLQYASANTLTDGDRPLWFLNASVNQGQSVTVSNGGIFTDGSWNWGNGVIFLGADGLLTQSVPIGAAFLRVVAEPINSTSLLFNPMEATYL